MNMRGGDPIRPIRALLRGLEALETLNQQDGSTVTEVANAASLPRTTAYRILETLCQGGFASRDPGDDRYRPTWRVRGLAAGFSDEPWVADVATPEMTRLCESVLWPLMLSMVRGGALQLRVVTDDISPLAIERYAPGTTVGLANSAAGVLRLGLAGAEERDTLLTLAAEQGAAPADCAAAREAAETASEVGYALDMRPVGREAAVAVPVCDGEQTLRAILSMRFIRSALTPEKVVSDFLPRLRACAERIGEAIPPSDPIGPSAPPRPANDSLRGSAANDDWPTGEAQPPCTCGTRPPRRETGA